MDRSGCFVPSFGSRGRCSSTCSQARKTACSGRRYYASLPPSCTSPLPSRRRWSAASKRRRLRSKTRWERPSCPRSRPGTRYAHGTAARIVRRRHRMAAAAAAAAEEEEEEEEEGAVAVMARRANTRRIWGHQRPMACRAWVFMRRAVRLDAAATRPVVASAAAREVRSLRWLRHLHCEVLGRGAPHGRPHRPPEGANHDKARRREREKNTKSRAKCSLGFLGPDAPKLRCFPLFTRSSSRAKYSIVLASSSRTAAGISV